jgi:hypothetical protein
MANIYKHLGLQVATKGAYLKAIGVPFYVLMQDRPFRYLQKRIRFNPSPAGSPWDITFMTFNYTDGISKNGQLDFQHVDTIRTSLENYTRALALDRADAADQREKFLAKVATKAVAH